MLHKEDVRGVAWRGVAWRGVAPSLLCPTHSCSLDHASHSSTFHLSFGLSFAFSLGLGLALGLGSPLLTIYLSITTIYHSLTHSRQTDYCSSIVIIYLPILAGVIVLGTLFYCGNVYRKEGCDGIKEAARGFVDFFVECCGWIRRRAVELCQ
jgi:hypothetical protein